MIVMILIIIRQSPSPLLLVLFYHTNNVIIALAAWISGYSNIILHLFMDFLPPPPPFTSFAYNNNDIYIMPIYIAVLALCSLIYI